MSPAPMTIDPRPYIRPVHEIAGLGLMDDAKGRPILALWLACFLQAFEAAYPEVTL